MNFTITVKMALVLLLICSGLSHFTFASNRLRSFRLPQTQRYNWTVSLNECNETNESFVTLYDEEDADFTRSFLGDQSAWLGLRKGRSLTWSDGAPVIFNISSVTLDNEQICEAMDNNIWTGFNCSERKPFMCYKDGNYTLIEKEKSWCQALQYCRKHFTDLVSISNGTENENVIKEGNNASFWIGLMHDEWEWEDRSCSSFRNWAERKAEGDCTIHSKHISSQPLYGHKCGGESRSFCSKGIMRIKVINLNYTWEQAFDFCKAHHSGLLQIEDEEDQEAVAQWLNHTGYDSLFWIGLRQSRVFGFWIWRDTKVTWHNWKNDIMPQLPMSNQCGVINRTDYKWSDENCLVLHPFLCEEEIVFMKKSMWG